VQVTDLLGRFNLPIFTFYLPIIYIYPQQFIPLGGKEQSNLRFGAKKVVLKGHCLSQIEPCSLFYHISFFQ